MAKKKGRSITPKNPEMIGGKNSLPKTTKGTVDLKKMATIKEQRKRMTQVQKLTSKQTPSSKLKQEISKTPVKGISRLKSNSNQKKVATPSNSPTKQPSSKGISKLKAATPKTSSPKAPVKKGPSKGR